LESVDERRVGDGLAGVLGVVDLVSAGSKTFFFFVSFVFRESALHFANEITLFAKVVSTLYRK